MYVGISDNPDRRIEQHNRGYERTTRPYAPFDLVYSEVHPTRAEARKREKYFKGGSGRKQLKKLAEGEIDEIA